MTSVLVSSVRYSILTRPADPQSRSPNPQTKTDLQIQTIHAKPTYRMNPRSANKTTTGGGRKEERRVPCSWGVEQGAGGVARGLEVEVGEWVWPPSGD